MKRRTLILGVAGVSGCAGLPTSGPIRSQPRRSQAVGPGEVAIDPNPPAAGAPPELIVQGFLLAMATYQPGYQAARQYLTEAARSAWYPERGVTVYADGSAPRAVGDRLVLDAPMVGIVDPRGAYTPGTTASRYHHEFEFEQEQGEWRIASPPAGLLMSRYLFSTSFSPADVFFMDAGKTALVPDPRYLPRGNRVADAAVRALLAGPSDWLAPGVVSVLPAKASLAGGVAGQGTLTIPLESLPAPLTRAEQSMLAAQFAATLKQFPDVTAFKITVGGERLPVPESTPDGSIPLSAADPLDPVVRLTTQLFGIAGGKLVRIGDGPGAGARAVSGDFGTKARETSSFAVSSDGVEAAIVTGDTLVRGPVEGQGSKVVITGRDLLRPQFTNGGALWAMTASGAATRIIGDTVEQVPTPGLAGLRIVSFRIASDGIRIAVVAEDKGKRVLGLVRVEREPMLRLSGWRPLPVHRDGTPVGDLLDVGWTSPTSLVVLVASGQTEQGVFELDVDAVQIRETGRAERWGATMLAASPRAGTATRTVVLAQDQIAWQYVDAFRWARLAEGISAVNYPG
jgi:hypothetical protein